MSIGILSQHYHYICRVLNYTVVMFHHLGTQYFGRYWCCFWLILRETRLWYRFVNVSFHIWLNISLGCMPRSTIFQAKEMHFSRLLTHDAKLPPEQHGSFQKAIIIAKFEWYLSNCMASHLPIKYCICIQMMGHIFRGCNCSIWTETLWLKRELERDLWCGQNFMCVTWLSKMMGCLQRSWQNSYHPSCFCLIHFDSLSDVLLKRPHI